MPDSAKPPVSSDASATGKKTQSAAPNLRPLAPKPLPPPPVPPPDAQSLAIRTTTTLSGANTETSRRRSPTACPVCLRVGCQLPTHSAYTYRSQSSTGSTPDGSSSVLLQRDPVFASSYAYKLGQSYNAGDTATTFGVMPSFNLPVGPELNTPEMHQLFHSWFVTQAHTSLRLPRPPEMVSDLIWGPFFLPALQDPLLCLSVLAASATIVARYNGQQARNVTSLTLLGQAIQLMRERISTDPTHISDITITAAVYIWIVNIYLEDTTTMASHASSIYAFVESRGGLSELGYVGAVARCIRWVDIAHSINLSQPCHYTDPPDPIPSFSFLAVKYGTFWDTSDRLAKHVLASSVIKTCQKTCRLIEAIEHVETEGCTPAEYTQLVDRLCALHTKTSLVRTRYQEQGQIDGCVVLAISLFHWQCFERVQALELGVRASVPRLASAIQSTGNPSFWQKDPQLLMWLLVIVVMIPFDTPEVGWCLPFLSQVIATQYGTDGRLRGNWKNELRACLHQFAWSDLRLEESLTRVCQLISAELGQEEVAGQDTDEET